MTFDQAVEMVQGWPEDRSVPRKLARAIESTDDTDRFWMQQLVEVLMVAAATEADLKLIEKHFD